MKYLGYKTFTIKSKGSVNMQSIPKDTVLFIPNKPTTVKTIQATLTIKTGISNYDICEFIEQHLMNSSLNNSEQALNVMEVKVIDETK